MWRAYTTKEKAILLELIHLALFQVGGRCTLGVGYLSMHMHMHMPNPKCTCHLTRRGGTRRV